MKSIACVAAAICASVLFAATALKADQAREEIAVRQAEAWLAIVDAGDYEESWNQASGYLKGAVPKEQWLSSMNGYRKPLGEVLERKMMNRQYATSLPGAPDGEYVVIRFSTRFAGKRESVETVTPMLDADGTWRVSGYFIK